MNTKEILKMVAEDEALRAKITAECKTPRYAPSDREQPACVFSFR